MAATSFGLLSALMMGMAGLGSGLTAFPPGERDAAFLNCAPADALVYLEWASRGEGVPGGEGVDGLAADPEVRAFITDLKSAIISSLEKDGSNAPPMIAKDVLPVAFDLMNRAGCLYITYTPPEPAADGEEGAEAPQWLSLASGATATLIFDGGDNADETEQHLLALLSEALGGSVNVPEKLSEVPLPLPLPVPGIEAIAHREGNHFIVAVGKGSLARAQAGLKGEVKGLGDAEDYQANLKLVDMQRVGSIAWINLARIREEGFKVAGPFGQVAKAMMGQLGVDEMNSLLSVTGVIEGQVASRTYLETGGKTEGLLSLTAGRGLEAKDFQQVPADCDFLASFTLDVPLVRNTLKTLVTQVQPDLLENYNQIESQLESDLGFSFEEDFLKAYGQQLTLFDSPAAGGLFLTSLTFAVEVTDAEKADEIFGKLMTLVKGSLPGDRSSGNSRRGVFLEEREFLSHKIYYVNTIGDDDVPIAPAFCQTKNQLLVSLHPQALKAHLRFLDEGGPTYAERFAAGAPEGTVISYGSFAAEKLLKLLYSVAPFGAQVGLTNAQRSGFDMDIFSIPSAKALVPYLQEARSWVVRTEDGLLFESRSSVPASIFSGIPFNLLFMTSGVRMGVPLGGQQFRGPADIQVQEAIEIEIEL